MIETPEHDGAVPQPGHEHGSNPAAGGCNATVTRNPAIARLADRHIEELLTAPESVQREVLDFLLFLKARHAARGEGREDLWPLGASAWAADWSNGLEDEAWRYL